ncbi:hypothetical protein ACVIIV_002709 [Bradyrhizobium sp. USDA 4354]
MTMSIEQLWSLPETALVGTYAEARRRYVEKKFERDTLRTRLEWMRAKLFVNTSGGVTERRMAVDVSEELARKGQEVRRRVRREAGSDARPACAVGIARGMVCPRGWVARGED